MSNADVFAEIAAKYDRINRLLSLGRDQSWRSRVVARLPEGRLLDLGAGTGAANELFAPRDAVALDPAPGMLSLNELPRRVVAVGERLPFVDEAFDSVFSAFVLRNLDSIPDTLGEIHRVLRPGGFAGVVGLGRPRGRLAAAAHRAGTFLVLNAVGVATHAREEYAYLHRSLDKLAPPEELFSTGPLRVADVWRMGPLGFVYGAVLAKDG